MDFSLTEEQESTTNREPHGDVFLGSALVSDRDRLAGSIEPLYTRSLVALSAIQLDVAERAPPIPCIVIVGQAQRSRPRPGFQQLARTGSTYSEGLP